FQGFYFVMNAEHTFWPDETNENLSQKPRVEPGISLRLTGSNCPFNCRYVMSSQNIQMLYDLGNAPFAGNRRYQQSINFCPESFYTVQYNFHILFQIIY